MAGVTQRFKDFIESGKANAELHKINVVNGQFGIDIKDGSCEVEPNDDFGGEVCAIGAALVGTNLCELGIPQKFIDEENWVRIVSKLTGVNHSSVEAFISGFDTDEPKYAEFKDSPYLKYGLKIRQEYGISMPGEPIDPDCMCEYCLNKRDE